MLSVSLLRVCFVELTGQLILARVTRCHSFRTGSLQGAASSKLMGFAAVIVENLYEQIDHRRKSEQSRPRSTRANDFRRRPPGGSLLAGGGGQIRAQPGS